MSPSLRPSLPALLKTLRTAPTTVEAAELPTQARQALADDRRRNWVFVAILVAVVTLPVMLGVIFPSWTPETQRSLTFYGAILFIFVLGRRLRQRASFLAELKKQHPAVHDLVGGAAVNDIPSYARSRRR